MGEYQNRFMGNNRLREDHRLNKEFAPAIDWLTDQVLGVEVFVEYSLAEQDRAG